MNIYEYTHVILCLICLDPYFVKALHIGIAPSALGRLMSFQHFSQAIQMLRRR